MRLKHQLHCFQCFESIQPLKSLSLRQVLTSVGRGSYNDNEISECVYFQQVTGREFDELRNWQRPCSMKSANTAKAANGKARRGTP
jgi:hypothetical protein